MSTSTERSRRADRARTVRAPLAAAALTLLLAVTSCGAEVGDAGSSAPSSTVTQAATASEPELSFTLPGTLAAGFAQLRATLLGHYGMAVMAEGGEKMVTFGDWTTGPAWSTIKVPLTIAAIRRNAANGGYAADAAITQSDNAAADVLWKSLGAGPDAAKAVETVLREGGDEKTTVPAARIRSEHSAFGQAQWSLAEQVRFASRLPCVPQSSTVVDLMERIVPTHRWGLGAFTGAEFKGGWGPDASGNYLVRQFGLIATPTGRVAVAIAAQPDSGTFADGMTALDKMAALISEHLGELASGNCSS